MLIQVRLPAPLPAEGGHMTAGFPVGFSQWGADLLPGQSTSVKTATACTHMHSTLPTGKKKEKKIKGETGGADRHDDKVRPVCKEKKKLQISKYLVPVTYKTMLDTDIRDHLLYVICQ